MSQSGDSTVIVDVDAHIKKHVAEVTTVLHERVSDELHIDVHYVKSSLFRRYQLLVTSGMSALPMRTPDEAREFRFAELCIVLDRHWRVSPEAFADERWYWPIRLLKGLARYPFENETWAAFGHSVANGSPPIPYAPDTKLCASVLLPPLTLGRGFSRMRRLDGADTFFWVVVPIYANELEFKLQHGTDALLAAFDAARLNDIVTKDRPSIR